MSCWMTLVANCYFEVFSNTWTYCQVTHVNNMGWQWWRFHENQNTFIVCDHWDKGHDLVNVQFVYWIVCQVSIQFPVTSVCDNVHSIYSTVPVDFKCMLEAKLDICVRRNVTIHSANMGVPNWKRVWWWMTRASQGVLTLRGHLSGSVHSAASW